MLPPAFRRETISGCDPILVRRCGTLTADRLTSEPPGAPPWSWANLISLDAVAVGLLWQLVFTIEFCDRLPNMAEAAMLGLTIWLAYTADRLLDSARLELSQPHTSRHRVHLEYRKYLITAWVVALAIDAALVVTCATDSQLRWGYIGVAVVLAYVAGVQFRYVPRWWIPKELQAGMVFALGVSLLSWSEVGSDRAAALFVSTSMAGLLFAANCFAVASWECDLDASQGFTSWVTRYPNSSRWLTIGLLGLLTITALLFVCQSIPLWIAVCLITSNWLLLAVVLSKRNRARDPRPGSVHLTLPNPFGVLADAALVIPPITWFVMGAVLR